MRIVRKRTKKKKRMKEIKRKTSRHTVRQQHKYLGGYKLMQNDNYMLDGWNDWLVFRRIVIIVIIIIDLIQSKYKKFAYLEL